MVKNKIKFIQKKMKDNTDNKTNNKVEELEQKIAELETKNVEFENNWKRALADYQNLQKRTSEDKINFMDFANSTLVRRLLPIIDNLEMLEKHLNDEGLVMILKEFKQVLKDENVEEINPVDEFFDATQMEAIDTMSGEKNKVLVVVQKGYLLKKKLLRPARVKVGDGSTEE